MLRPRRGGGLASTSGYQVTFTTDAGAAAIRVTDASGVTRVARKVDLYRREEVAFRSGKVSLAGTLFVPFGAGPHPAVVLAGGSGPRDRQGLLLMADLFARNGIAALAYDKRGSGDSTGSYRTIGADFRSLAEDVVAGVGHLRGRGDIDPGRVGVWGVSEGGYVVALAAASPEVAFVVGVSAPGVSAIASFLWQNEQALRHGGVSDAAVSANTRAMTVLYRAARSLGLVERGQVSWDLDPAAAWARVGQPVLLIYGEHDRLVPPARSATVITQALAEAGNAGHSVVRVAGTDHAIFVSEDGFRSPQDYERGSLGFGAGYLDTMVDWVRATVAGQPSPVPGWRPGAVERVPAVDGRPWHEHPALHLGLGAVFVAVFACAVLAPPARGILRRVRHRRPDAWPPGVRRARRWAWLASASGLLVLLAVTALTVVFAGAPATAIRVGLRALATVTTLVVVALVAATAVAWRETWPGRARLGHGAVVATAVANAAFLAYWRLLG
ncbi:MAG: prolyl oligopeptidase family serine peptidase [Actinomycetota bacterium]|nr:prolyl oligopeptidase family serine peptidase [Actinomycetota bacterium]